MLIVSWRKYEGIVQIYIGGEMTQKLSSKIAGIESTDVVVCLIG